MYFKHLETDAATKAKYNEAHSKHAAERMKVVRKKAAAIRRAKKSSA